MAGNYFGMFMIKKIMPILPSDSKRVSELITFKVEKHNYCFSLTINEWSWKCLIQHGCKEDCWLLVVLNNTKSPLLESKMVDEAVMIWKLIKSFEGRGQLTCALMSDEFNAARILLPTNFIDW